MKPRNLPPRRLRVDVTLDAELHAWLSTRVGPGKPFDSMSHAFECAVRTMRYKRRVARMDRARPAKAAPPARAPPVDAPPAKRGGAARGVRASRSEHHP